MSSSIVTYTSVYSDSEPWRFQWVSDEEPEAPEEAPQSLEQAPPSPDYVHGTIEDQPLPTDGSPTALSPGYVADSDPSKEDPKEDPAKYPPDEGDDDDDDEESSEADDDEEDEAFEEEEEEKEHLALADSTTLSAIDPEPMEDQPLPVDALPTALSPGYVVDSDPKKDEKDPKEDPADYPADRGDNDDNESSNDDDDDDEEDKEEEEHLAPADPSDISTDDLLPSS
nr:hypothetical protein [Tanacetum cinerariifolium]